MADRKTECSLLSLRVIGTELREGEDKARRFTHPIENLRDLLLQIKTDFKGLSTSIFEVDLSRSQKYQKVGIEKIRAKTLNGVLFYHFRLAYIRRERGNIKVRDLDKEYKPRTIKLGETEYEYLPLHITISPNDGFILLDNRCHTGPTEQFLHSLLLPLLDKNDFGLDTAAEMDSGFRVNIVPLKEKNFSAVLKKRLQTISQVGFTIAKRKDHGAGLDRSTEDVLGTRRVGQFLKKMASTLLGKKYEADILSALPLKQVKILMTFDEKADALELKQLKKKMSGSLEQIVESHFIKDSMLSYHDDQTHRLHKMLFTGVAVSEINPLPVKKLDKSLLVWKEQRRVYRKTKSALRKIKAQENG